MTTSETVENTLEAEATFEPLEVEAPAHNHEGHDHEAHDHEGHDHAGHTHAPAVNPECVREVKIEASVEEVDKTFSSVLKEYKKYAKIPGFRAGKVPESVVKRRFAEQIKKDVVERLLPERFQAAIGAAGFVPVSQPQLNSLTLEEGKALDGTATFEVVPAFSLDGYQDVTVPKPAVEATEEEFQQELKQLRESRATVEPVEIQEGEDRPLVDGDWVQISYAGEVKADGEGAVPPLAGQDALVEIGGAETLAAFTDALRGSKVGQELQVEVTYPADYNENNLAGKTVAYNIEVKAIKKRILPELTDEFATELGDYENLTALETRIREHLLTTKQRQSEQEVREALFAALAAKFDFPVPEGLVQQQIDARLDRGLRALAQQGMNADMMRKLDFGRLRSAQRDSAVNEVKTSLLLDRIADAENLSVTDEEVDREIYMAALQQREPVETLKARLTQDGGIARIREQLRREKTASLLYQRLPPAA